MNRWHGSRLCWQVMQDTLVATVTMQPIPGNDGLDRRQLGHLMTPRLGIVAQLCSAATVARFGFDVERCGHLLRRHQIAPVRLVTLLPTTLLPGGEFRRRSLD